MRLSVQTLSTAEQNRSISSPGAPANVAVDIDRYFSHVVRGESGVT
jgi:hypothetical protein